MAQHLMDIWFNSVTSRFTPSCISRLAWLVLLILPGVATAHMLKDPTQPPAAFYSLTGDTQPDALLAGPVLQSIIHGVNYHAAIINGQKVVLGKKYEHATLIKLTAREAVLRYPDKTLQTLILNDTVYKKMSGSHGTSKTRKAGG